MFEQDKIFHDERIWKYAKPGITSMPPYKYVVRDLDYNEYNLNSYGFRSRPLDKKNDLLVAGCSFTFGAGVSFDGIWSSQVARKLNLEHDNMGGIGKSVPWIINNIFNYFDTFGHPKILMCLFPDFLRMEILCNSDHIKSSVDFGVEDSGLTEYAILMQDYYKKAPLFSRKPHNAEYILPAETFMYIAIQYIKMLEMYCNTNNIKFLWGTWHGEQNKYLKKNIDNLYFNNFVATDCHQWHTNYVDNKERFHKIENSCIALPDECVTYTDCHSELREIYGKNFDAASDISKNNLIHHHFGVHQHTHIAESFLNNLNI